jgi:hypothetical protein
MRPPKAQPVNTDNKEFWIGLGKEMGETKSCAQEVGKKVDALMSNHIPHLECNIKELDGKIDKLAVRIAYIVGGIMALEFVVQVGVRLLSK